MPARTDSCPSSASPPKAARAAKLCAELCAAYARAYARCAAELAAGLGKSFPIWQSLDHSI